MTTLDKTKPSPAEAGEHDKKGSAATSAAQAFAASPLMKVLSDKHDERVARRAMRG